MTDSWPMMPPAPGRSSTTNGWPSAELSLSATMRVSRSAVPAAENGTTIRTGRVGHDAVCATAPAHPATHRIGRSAARAATLMMEPSMRRLLDHLPEDPGNTHEAQGEDQCSHIRYGQPIDRGVREPQ